MPATWYDGITYTVEAGLSAATGSYAIWDTSLWNTGTWGPDTVWTDISIYAIEFNTDRGFERDVNSWETGRAQVVLKNGDGRFSPNNLSGPYVVGGVTSIRPWRPIRISILGVNIYTGYVLSWKESYSRAHAMSVTTLECVDELGSLARFDGFETSEVGAGESSGRRIHRILNNAGHIGNRAIDVGRFTVQGTTLAQNAVSELKLTNDSEGGALWVEVDGTIYFENRYALLENSRSNTVQAIFDDSPNTVNLPCTNIETSYDGDLLVNIASYARKDGTEQLEDDLPSRALYGDASNTRHDLILETDAQVNGLALLDIQLHKDAELRVESVTFTPRRKGSWGPLLLIQALGRRVRDLITVNVTPAGGHAFSQDCHISGISHSFNHNGDWFVTWELQSAEPWLGFVSSLWDTAVWNTSTWFI